MRSIMLGYLSCILLASAVQASPKPEPAMLRMDYEVSIGTLQLKGVESVAVESAIDLLSDKCTIQIPGQVRGQAYRVEDKIKRGDKVTVKLGYDGQLKTEFTGYLQRVNPNSPLKLECEDSIFLFRKPIKDKAFGKTTAIDILKYVVDQVNPQLSPTDQVKFVTDLSGLQYDKFTIVRATAYEVLDKLKQDLGIAIYCRGAELHAHLSYTEKRGQVTYDFMRNVEASESLQYVRAEQLRIQVKVIGRTKKGANVEVEVGEKGGDLRTFQKPSISDKVTLEKVGKEELKKLNYDGYKGEISAWLVPYVEIGYTAKVVDTDYPERAGNYYVKAVKTEFSSSGGRRSVSLGVKVSA